MNSGLQTYRNEVFSNCDENRYRLAGWTGKQNVPTPHLIRWLKDMDLLIDVNIVVVMSCDS